MVDNAPQPDKSEPDPESRSDSGPEPEPDVIPETPFMVTTAPVEHWGIEVTHAVEAGGTVTTDDGPLSPLEPE
ncbi:hypothetical protein CFK39_06495 [Brachybacterium avium]|uniref:Uncharacterized protein n=1 Tax=Brachybacterium avium TaxID=2017485 RepID=A0A220UC75_9MICO|nr:hypothetical protein [Brachybacterium avium]ASK65541.1 hypothetical protein CFK39_06495 [Brachybacterium avium]